MNIAVVGIGYVGLVSASCFAEMGSTVFCVDQDEKKIAQLQAGQIPIYETGLENLVQRNISENRLYFHTKLEEVLDQVEIVFIAVGTPSNKDGSADLQQVISVAQVFGKNISKFTLLVTKSTVPVGTSSLLKETIQKELLKRGESIEFELASNPEFLKEGVAIQDFMSPDRVVVGVESERAKKLMTKLYRPFLINNFRVLFMDIPSAEMTKYAANTMLATRISFMNEIANLCDQVGANIDMVRKGIGTDLRIGQKFLYAGCGYGGSCFPKDVKALIHLGKKNGLKMSVIEAVEEVNERQKKILFQKLQELFPEGLQDKKIAIWGCSFKPETDDMRQAPSLILIQLLLDAGAQISLFDPIAMPECKNLFQNKSISFCNEMYEASHNANALVLLTEWKQFRMPSWKILKKLMKNPIILDGRNIYNKEEVLEEGFIYKGIGK